MCRHIYDWNIVNCDVKQTIQVKSSEEVWTSIYLVSKSASERSRKDQYTVVFYRAKEQDLRSSCSILKLIYWLLCRKDHSWLPRLANQAPWGTRGLKSRMCPPYPHACRKRRLKWGAVIYIAQVADTALSDRDSSDNLNGLASGLWMYTIVYC